MRRGKLSRQIVLSMSLVCVITGLIGFVGSFVVYSLFFHYLPPPPASPSELPKGPDYLIAAVLLFLGLIVAILIAARLTRRLLTPLNSLAEGARRIAAGDLTARATPGDRSLGETAHLVDDFNIMAVKLQGMAANMAAWNAAVAHELRTPLTILQGRLQGMQDGLFAPTEESIRNLLTQVQGLSRLVEDLRTVSLQDSGHLELHIEPTAIGAQVHRAVDEMQPSLADAGLSVDVVTADVIVECDGVRVRQALTALLENARRYAAPGKLMVHLEAGHDVVLRVEDEGPGLEPDFAAQAFEPFTRAEPSRQRASGGSGLGLSVVRAIALAHGGDVRYQTSERGGAIFELRFDPRRLATAKPLRFTSTAL